MYRIKCIVHILFCLSLFISIEGCGAVKGCARGCRGCVRVAEEVVGDDSKESEKSMKKEKQNANDDRNKN